MVLTDFRNNDLRRFRPNGRESGTVLVEFRGLPQRENRDETLGIVVGWSGGLHGV